MNALLSFGAALVSLRLAGLLVRGRRYAWAAGLVSFAAAAAAMAWGSAHGWDAYSFRVYYLAGALLSAPLLGIGSLQLTGRRWAGPVGLLWAGVAIGLSLGLHVHGTFAGSDVPRAQYAATWLSVTACQPPALSACIWLVNSATGTYNAGSAVLPDGWVLITW